MPELKRKRDPLAPVPLHPSITEKQISHLVDSFYIDVAKDDRLGPIFLSRNNGDWGEHLAKMKLFWSSVLLKTGKYKGQPVVKHNAIEELQTSDFERWLVMFEKTAKEAFNADAVPLVMIIARRIANSLWLAKVGKIGEAPPF